MSTVTPRVRTRQYDGSNPSTAPHITIVDSSQVTPDPVHGLGMGAPWVDEELVVGRPLVETLALQVAPLKI